MNKIEKLIKEMCPDGVEYKRIEEICEIIVGGDKPKTCNKELTKPNLEYPFPIYSNNSKNDGLYGFSKTYTVNKKSVSISSIGTIGFHKLREPFYTPIIRLKILIPKNIKQITPEFLNYSLDMIDFSKIGGKQDTTLPSINTSDLQNIKIPIPPIEIQNEIVKILDTFTQLEAELEAELEARDKQYQYYRNKLLDFDNNQKLLEKLFEKDSKEINNKVHYEKLGGVVFKNSFKQVDANYISSINCESGDIKLLPSSNNYDWFAKSESVDDSLINNGEVITLGRARYANIKYWNGSFISSNNITITSCNVNKMLNKFLYYFLVMNNEKFYVSSSTYPKFDNDIFDQFLIPIPSLEVQNKIVNILDKLQDYSKDIKTGLPLEIEQRQKQYEYYRNLLLDFKANAQGGALANSYIEMLNWIEQKLLYQVEYKKLWELVNFDKKFNNVEKYKQDEILHFVHISAKKLKEYKLNSNGNVKILSTGNYEGFIDYIENDSNINFGEIISIPSGGSPILKYYKGYFIDSLNILFSSKNTSKINLKFIYYFLINDIFFIEENFRGSSIKHPNMSTIIEINIPLPSIEVQNKIVNILDKLQDYSKDIKTGLPLKIEQRQKQYEYYRNSLLKFKKYKE